MRRLFVCVWLIVAWTAPVFAQAPDPAAAAPAKKPKPKKKKKKPKKKPATRPIDEDLELPPAQAAPPLAMPTPPPAAAPAPPPAPAPEPEPTPAEPEAPAPPPKATAASDDRPSWPPLPSEPPPPDRRPPPSFVLRVDPGWGYRRFVDAEPSSTDKHFGTAGVFLLGFYGEVYPLNGQPAGIFRDVGVYGSYTRAIGLHSDGFTSMDFDSNQSVPTEWSYYNVGLRARLLGRSGPFALAVFGGFESWKFAFDAPIASIREVPTGQYGLLQGGVDARQSFGMFRVQARAMVLYPQNIEPLGDRYPLSRSYGARAGFGFGFKLGVFETDIEGLYTVVRFSLHPVFGRDNDAPGQVSDQYFGGRLGIGVAF